MEMLGPHLSDLFLICNNKFSLQTVLLITIQALTRIQDLHSRNYLHRDIKPENFLIGIDEKSNMIYLIDFGLSKKYKDPKTMDHIPYRENRSLIGTARYASINTHLGVEQSRRDDLESIGYLILFFLKKRLPWQGSQGSNKHDKYNKILEKKLSVPVEILGRDIPYEFTLYMNYVKNLRFDERPDYNFLKGIFINLLIKNYEEKYMFDWIIPNFEEPPNKKKIELSNSENLKYERKRGPKSISEKHIINSDEFKSKRIHKSNSYVFKLNIDDGEKIMDFQHTKSMRIKEESSSDRVNDSELTEKNNEFNAEEFAIIIKDDRLNNNQISQEQELRKFKKQKTLTNQFLKIDEFEKF